MVRVQIVKLGGKKHKISHVDNYEKFYFLTLFIGAQSAISGPD